MADLRISELPAATVPGGTDLFPTTQGSTGPGTGTTRKITTDQIFSLLVSPPPIGTTTPAAGQFSSLGVTGLSTFGSASANYATLDGGAAASAVTLTLTGSDTNVDMRFTPKGQGVVHSNRFSVGTFAASSTYAAARRFTAFTSTTATGPALGAIYRFGGTLTGTLSANYVGAYATVLDSDTLQFSDTTNGMIMNYIGQTLNAGWSGGRATQQIQLNVVGAGNSSILGTSTNAYHVALGAFAYDYASMGGVSSGAAGNVFGFNTGVKIINGSGYHLNAAIGAEIDVGMESQTEASLKSALKLVLWGNDAVRGTFSDEALNIGLTANITTSPGWRTGFGLGAYEAWWPFTASSRIMGLIRTAASIAAGAPAYTFGVGIDFTGITAVESTFKSNGFKVDGSGNLGALTSSGVALQTRSAVTAKTAVVNTITVIEGGQYVGAVTLTCSAPTGSGTTATASVATYALTSASLIDTRGTNYAVGDTFSITDGTYTVVAVGVVTVVSAGTVFGIKLTTTGNYSVVPAGAMVTTTLTGVGSGLTLTPVRAILTVTVTNPGTNYSEFLPPIVTSAGATTTFRQALFNVSMTATQANLALNPAGQVLFPNQGAVAAAGTTQGTATAITSDYLDITAGVGATGVRLPAAVAGMRKVLSGAAANAVSVQIYPTTGEELYIYTLGGAGVNNPQAMAATEAFAFECTIAGRWYGYQIS